jgi:hypothetical protein
MEGKDESCIMNYKKMISHGESPYKGRMLDAWPVVIALQQLQPSKDDGEVSVLVEVACVEVHKAHDVFNADVALVVVVQLPIAEALALQALCIGASIHLFLPVFVRFREQLSQLYLPRAALLVLEGVELLRGEAQQEAQLVPHHPHSVLTNFGLQIPPLLIGRSSSQLHPAPPHPVIKLDLEAELLGDLHGLLPIVIDRVDLDLEFVLSQWQVLAVDPPHRHLVLGLSRLYTLLVLSLLPLGLLDLLLDPLQLVVNHSHTSRAVTLPFLPLLHQSNRQKTILLPVSTGWSLV